MSYLSVFSWSPISTDEHKETEHKVGRQTFRPPLILNRLKFVPAVLGKTAHELSFCLASAHACHSFETFLKNSRLPRRGGGGGGMGTS